MLKEPIKFFEYEPKYKQELKTDYGMREHDFKQILRLNKKVKSDLIQVFGDRLKATSNVGILTIGKNTIQILPKIAKGDQEQKIIENLLFMLSYTKKLKIKETEISKLCERKENKFFEILIYLFSKNLRETIQNNPFKNYDYFNDDLFFIRGKILFNENLARNFARKDRIHCKFSEFTENILINQIFKYTIFLLQRVTGDQENYRLLKQLELILSDVSLKIITQKDFQKVHLNRLNRYLEPLIQMSRLFITQSAIQLFQNKLETFLFVFKMEKLFEEFIAEFIKRNKSKLFTSEATVKPQDKTRKLVDLPKPLFTLQPDILIRSQGKKLIIDTKYKILNPKDPKFGVSQADMYQMLAYSVKHDCKNTALLYPEHLSINTPEKPYSMFVKEEEIKVHIKTVPLDIDLRRNQQLLIEKLKPICNLIYS